MKIKLLTAGFNVEMELLARTKVVIMETILIYRELLKAAKTARLFRDGHAHREMLEATQEKDQEEDTKPLLSAHKIHDLKPKSSFLNHFTTFLPKKYLSILHDWFQKIKQSKNNEMSIRVRCGTQKYGDRKHETPIALFSCFSCEIN